MKYFKSLLPVVLTLITLNVAAQTIDEIVAKNVDAMGGKEKLLTLKTVKMTGSMSVQGTDVSIVSTRTQLAGMRTDIEVMGTSNYQVANTTKGTVFMPIFRMAAPEPMSQAEYTSTFNQFDLQGPFLNYKEKGHSIELKGTEKLDGADVWKLLVTFKNGKKMDFFIDTKTARVVKTSSTETVNGEEVLAVIGYADYKQNADGYWFPYSVTNERGTIAYSDIETNKAVDEGIYKN